MSRKLLLFSVLTAWGIAASAQSGQGPVKAPLGKAIDHTAANAAKNPQSEGLGNANAQQTRNQERFIAKHIDNQVAASSAQAAGGQARKGQGPVKAPLGKAIDHTAANAAKNPQSEGLGNANAQQTRNQERFIAKHIDGRVSGPERVERVERVERAERPERVERVERPERVERVERVERPSRPERAERPERPGKGR